MTEREKMEVFPTLSIEGKFKGLGKAKILATTDIETRHGKKMLQTIEALEDADKCKKGENYNYFVNMESNNNLVEAFGTNDDEWIGKEIKLEISKDEFYNKDKILAKEIK
tara:strand:+ start:427 stop:756 length:330 start_codon:yes stop_codon:yes gene_type:complete